MTLERSLHEVSENHGLLQKKLETLKAKMNEEKDKFINCLAESSQLFSNKERQWKQCKWSLQRLTHSCVLPLQISHSY
jgi:uncharacterized membrane-anchored protein YhcB (DUF1043 family)